MSFLNHYTEQRIVIAQVDLVWELLSNCSYLSKWMPFIVRVEHLGKDTLSNGSILWVETIVGDKENQSLCTVVDCLPGRRIAFYSEQEGIKVYYRFELEQKKHDMVSISMMTEIKMNGLKNRLFRKKIQQEFVSYGWMQLDALDKAITEYRTQSKYN